MKKYVIAIDGHSSCGKSTLAKDLAKKINYKHIDTGAMYRAVTLYAIRNNIAKNGKLDEAALLNHIKDDKIKVSFTTTADMKTVCTLNGEIVELDIRQPIVNKYVSPVATLAFVRKEMREAQQAMGKEGGIVMEGRDIGTAVFPDADLKIFLTANPDIRAQRRHREQLEKGITLSIEETKAGLLERDKIDSERAVDPLRKADDARVIDNSDLTREQQTELVARWVEELTTPSFGHPSKGGE